MSSPCVIHLMFGKCNKTITKLWAQCCHFYTSSNDEEGSVDLVRGERPMLQGEFEAAEDFDDVLVLLIVGMYEANGV